MRALKFGAKNPTGPKETSGLSGAAFTKCAASNPLSKERISKRCIRRL